MHIYCLGLNHRTAGLNLRERLAFQEESAKAALSRLGCGLGSQPDAISEMVILSTCNRVEIYAASPHTAFDALELFLEQVQGVPAVEFRPHLYRLIDEQAVEHLFRVASGLDSLVLGEPQILGQVMVAFQRARSQGSAGPVLSRLFQAALHTGKRARTETNIGHNPSSVSSVAARLVEEAVNDLRAAQIVVLGAGEMAELAVEALRKRGAERILVINRTLERANSLAERWHGSAGTFENLPEALRLADILIASTGAPHPLIYAETVAEVMHSRTGRGLFMIDIAVPRDIDEGVGLIPGVQLYNMDSLHERLKTSLARRAQEVPHVELILETECASFMEYLRSLDILPVIAAMSQQAEAIRQAELKKTLSRMPDLSDQERERLEAMTEALVKKILHAPITRLRSEASSSQSAQYAAAARALFALENHPAPKRTEQWP